MVGDGFPGRNLSRPSLGVRPRPARALGMRGTEPWGATQVSAGIGERGAGPWDAAQVSARTGGGEGCRALGGSSWRSPLRDPGSAVTRGPWRFVGLVQLRGIVRGQPT